MLDGIWFYRDGCRADVTGATAFAIVSIRGKCWWLCINEDGTPFFIEVIDVR